MVFYWLFKAAFKEILFCLLDSSRGIKRRWNYICWGKEKGKGKEKYLLRNDRIKKNDHNRIPKSNK